MCVGMVWFGSKVRFLCAVPAPGGHSAFGAFVLLMAHGFLVAAQELAFPRHLSALPAKLLWHCFPVLQGSIYPHGCNAVTVMAFNS